tara:strand:+ start:929 stop:2347 length:1419 start_codon:yes stop_codon:yes gene_type:complete
MIVGSFIVFLVGFLLIGVLSVFQSKKDTSDYLVAGKSVPAWLTGLSAVATNNSGFMFIGMIGATYSMGLSSIWLMIGWIIGDFIASILTVKPIRVTADSSKIHSFGGLLSQWHGGDYKVLRTLIGIFTVVFLSVYAAAQLKAGSKATTVLLGWDTSTGIIIGAVIVLVYSVSGGLRASIWTDAAQAMVMIVGMALLTYGGFSLAGGWDQAVVAWQQATPTYLDLFPDKGFLGIVLFILGWVFGGMAVIGQPHVVIRFISLDSPESVSRMRFYYYTWFTLFYGATIVVGMLSRIVFPESGQFDAELALPKMAMEILPDVMVGLVLAALFAATMSTADSLILSCSAAISRDFTQLKKLSLWGAKTATFTILVIACLIALTDNKSVFALVLDAWGMLGSAFAPLIIVKALGHDCSQRMSVSMIATGLLTFLGWQYAGLGGLIYSVGPGIVAGLICFGGFWMLGHSERVPAPEGES